MELMELSDVSNFSRIVDYKFQYLLVTVTRGLRNGYGPLRRKPFNDLWHVCKGLCKQILKASKEKGCELLVYWIRGIRTHLYWSAMSTKMGYGDMIVAKWKSVVRHITNKHEDHPDELFPECAHDELDDRLWLQVGMY